MYLQVIAVAHDIKHVRDYTYYYNNKDQFASIKIIIIAFVIHKPRPGRSFFGNVSHPFSRAY